MTETTLTNTSTAALMGDLSLDAEGAAQFERAQFERNVLEAVANGARLGLNLVGEGALALRMQSEGDSDCSVLLGHMHYRANVAGLYAENRVAERKGRYERADAALARVRELEAGHRERLERLAVRSEMARTILAEMDNPPEGYYA